MAISGGGGVGCEPGDGSRSVGLCVSWVYSASEAECPCALAVCKNCDNAEMLDDLRSECPIDASKKVFIDQHFKGVRRFAGE